jgi:hypothetical protein
LERRDSVWQAQHADAVPIPPRCLKEPPNPEP